MSQQATSVLDPVRSGPAALRRVPVRWILAGAALALAFLPLLIAHGNLLWLRPHYQFFPLVLAGALVLAWPVFQDPPYGRPGSAAHAISFALVGLSWLLLAAGVVLDSPWSGAVACLMLLASVPLGLGGWPLLRAFLPALALLLLIIPPPFGLDARLVGYLQYLTGRVSSHVLDFIGVYHYMSGNVVEAAGKRYMVEEACSGIHSLFSILACTVFYILWARVHWLRAACLILAAVFWVMVQNVSRVVLIAFVGNRWNIDLSTGWQHYALDFVLFGISLLLLASTDRFLRFLGESFSWDDMTQAAQTKAVRKPAAAAAGPRAPARWLPAWGLAVAFAVLALPQLADLILGVTAYAASSTAYAGSALIQEYNKFSRDTLPPEIEGWQRQNQEKDFETRDSDNTLGEFSRTWRYLSPRGDQAALVSFDYPFPMWHDLRGCYVNTGWTRGPERDFRIAVPDSDLPLYAIQVKYTQPNERHGYLWFTEFDQAGMPSWPSMTELRWKPRLDAIRDSWLYLLGQRERAAPKNSAVLQVQVFLERYDVLPEKHEEEVEKFFIRAAELLRGRCLSLLGGADAGRR
jgi:exosortase